MMYEATLWLYVSVLSSIALWAMVREEIGRHRERKRINKIVDGWK